MNGARRLDTFFDASAAAAQGCAEAADCVTAIVPLMERLVSEADGLFAGRTLHSDPDHYTRNLIRLADDGSLSLYAIVWRAGQWTPVHDHGSWGVVGVVEGALEERSFMSPDGTIRRDEGIRLMRGGVIRLRPGSVTSFVPNPDHIHETGAPAERTGAVTLHLYGRTMNSFHVYDVAAGRRRLIDVPHKDS
jgi:predicted metal-dependent enzyme (double-stranded beta helix superfamily)